MITIRVRQSTKDLISDLAYWAVIIGIFAFINSAGLLLVTTKTDPHWFGAMLGIIWFIVMNPLFLWIFEIIKVETVPK